MAGVKRRWRDLFGIAAPRLAVRPHLPWHWRALGTTLMLAVSVALGAWLYDAVTQVAGGPGGVSEQAAALKRRVDELESDLATLRAGGAVEGSARQIERSTQDSLVRQVRLLEEENARLKEDLALFERLEAIGGRSPGLTIDGLHVDAEPVPGRYRYRALVASQGGKGEKEVRLSLQLAVSLKRPEGHAMIVFPAADDPDRQRYALSVRHFRRVEGSFQIPEDAQVVSVEMRLLQDGATRATQRVTP